MVTDNGTLIQLMHAIGSGNRDLVTQLIADTPILATACLAKGSGKAHSDEFFLDTCSVQIYVGHTALHVAAAVYDLKIARDLVAAGADVHAQNRRGATPLHAATGGSPGSPRWNPAAQAAIIASLIEAGADPEAAAEGGVTPLQRAVRNRCSAAVQALLNAGADPHRRNRNGSTAFTLTQWTTGRGGTGSPEAKLEQAEIVRMLHAAGR
jgi:hypothetical protein